MKIRRTTLGLLVAGAIVAGCGSDTPTGPGATPAPTPTPPPPPRVMILSIDGLRPDALLRTQAPNILGLLAQGASASQARTINQSTTLPSHASMLSGYGPEVHRVTWDTYQASRKILVPTLFTATRAAAKRSVMVVGKEKFNHFRDTGFVDTYVLTLQGDDAVANEAVVQMQTSFDLLFVHFPDVDLTGHASGWLSSAYLDRLANVDRAVGRLLLAMPQGTTVLLTADHGGSGMGHGTNAIEHVTIPWMIAGPKIKRGHAIAGRVNTVDTAATVAHILNVKLQSDVTGKVVSEALQ